MKRWFVLLPLGLACLALFWFQSGDITDATGGQSAAQHSGKQAPTLVRPATPAILQGEVLDEPRKPGISLGGGTDALAVYLKQSRFPPDSRPLTENQNDTIDWNRRHETFRRTRTDDDVSFRFTADRYIVTGNDPVNFFLQVQKLGRPSKVSALEMQLYAEGASPITIALHWRNGSYFASSNFSDLAERARLQDQRSNLWVRATVHFRHGKGDESAEIRFRYTPSKATPAVFGQKIVGHVSGAGDFIVRVPISVRRSGHYILDANLWDANNRPIASSRVKRSLTKSDGFVDYRFFGKAILSRDPLPPFTLRQVRGSLYQPGMTPDLADIRGVEEFPVPLELNLDSLENKDWDSAKKRQTIEVLEEVALP